MSKLPKFKVGQKVRFKSHKELKLIGQRWSIKIDDDFEYSTEIFTIGGIELIEYLSIDNGYYYTLNEYHKISHTDYAFSEEFFQVAYKLDDRFKGL